MPAIPGIGGGKLSANAVYYWSSVWVQLEARTRQVARSGPMVCEGEDSQPLCFLQTSLSREVRAHPLGSYSYPHKRHSLSLP